MTVDIFLLLKEHIRVFGCVTVPGGVYGFYGSV